MSDTFDATPEYNGDPLVVIPCLNEAAHIGDLLRQLEVQISRLGGRIVVVDGGSTDGTQDIATSFTQTNPQITLLHNPRRIQSAAVNLAVAMDNGVAKHLIRIDAHCSYPDDFCEVLMRQAKSVYADSICVSMIAEGDEPVQRLNAATQNSSIGNGGSKHRKMSGDTYVEHGHHALIKVDAFKAVGGYDESFTHNEYAELDFRLREAGFRIWLTSQTVIRYHPRRTIRAIIRQYFNYGAGRARNLIKHSVLPRIRQTKVMMVLPAVMLTPFAAMHPLFLIPALLWVGYCLGSGVRMAWKEEQPALLLCGPVAMAMHLAWSVGFWQRVLRAPFTSPQRVAQ